MSLIVFAGSAQFTAVSILVGGGGLAAAIAAAGMMNSRFLAMGIALAPSLPGGPFKRAAAGPAGRRRLLGAGLAGRRQLRPLAAVRLHRAAVRHLGAGDGRPARFIGSGLDIEKLGLDAIYPTFFLALLLAELKDQRAARRGPGRRARSPSRSSPSPRPASRSSPPPSPP